MHTHSTRFLEEVSMADLEQLKQKYSPVIQTIQSFSDLGATVDSVSLDGDKLLLKATVPSQVVANRVWDVIKQVDPQYADLHHEIATSGGANQTYTVKSGDNLSTISKRFYGTANNYQKIAAASNIADANLIRVGQQITIPAL
jgi:nucleoid-associated protein YgaU